MTTTNVITLDIGYPRCEGTPSMLIDRPFRLGGGGITVALNNSFREFQIVHRHAQFLGIKTVPEWTAAMRADASMARTTSSR